jgi:catechol 2,3-dioxygenase-like lactoylglutathione lyase family enzyme
MSFYEKFFGAIRVNYRRKTQELFTERSFILMDQVTSAPRTNDGTALWHIGCAGVDGGSEFAWRVSEGIDVHTPLTRPVLPGIDNKVDVMYFNGPDKELVEVSTAGRHHRFDHVHLLASDVNATTDWFNRHLGLTANNPEAVDFFGIMMNSIQVDNVNIVIFGRTVPDRDNQFAAKELWPKEGFRPTESSAVDHIAFSFSSLEAVLRRMRSAGVQIVAEPAKDARYGHKSFSVRGPDQILIEIVEDRPLPEGIWSH